MATQNPIEQEGVYALPEAQRDRFLFKLNIDYPTPEEEREIVYRMGVTPPEPKQILATGDLLRLQDVAANTFVHHALVDYVVRVVTATRKPEKFGMPDAKAWIAYGASPRASLGIIAAARALASGAWPRLRHPAGCRRGHSRRAAAPARADLRRARRRDLRGDGDQPDPADGRPAAGERYSAARPFGAARRARRSRRGQRSVTTSGRNVDLPSLKRGEIRDPALTAALRKLELTVRRKLDGVLHGDHLGLLPGPGSEPGESRLYQPGDDVRRMDWSVTARTTHPHVRQMIADRELETWLVVDMSASLDFGTTGCEKRDLAVAAAAAITFLNSGGGNRIGAIIANGDSVRRVPALSGRMHEQELLRTIATMPKAPPGVRGDLAAAIDALRRPERRRGMAVIISDFLGPIDWMRPLRAIAGATRCWASRSSTRATSSCRPSATSSCRTPNPGSRANSPSTNNCATTSRRPRPRTAPRSPAPCAAAMRRC